MKSIKKSRINEIIKSTVIPIGVAVLGFGLMFWGIKTYSGIQIEQNRRLTQTAIQKAAIQCYADEGRYPASVDYLVEHYGVNIDEDHFNVVYDCMASNICPTVEIYIK